MPSGDAERTRSERRALVWLLVLVFSLVKWVERTGKTRSTVIVAADFADAQPIQGLLVLDLYSRMRVIGQPRVIPWRQWRGRIRQQAARYVHCFLLGEHERLRQRPRGLFAVGI